MKALWEKFIAWEYHQYALIGTAVAVVILIGVIIALCVTGGKAPDDPSISGTEPTGIVATQPGGEEVTTPDNTITTEPNGTQGTEPAGGDEPTADSKEPTTENEEPTTDSKEPTTEYEEPTAGYTEPTTGYTKPTTGYPKPTTGYTKPTTGYTEPTTGYTEPTTGYTEPTTGYPKPTTGYTEPTTGYTEPTTGYTEPTTGYTEPTTGYTEPTIGYTEPTTGYTEPTIGYTEPTTGYTEPTTGYTEPTTGYTEPTTGYTEPTTSYTEPTTGYTEPTSGYTEPTAGYTEPTTGYTEPTTPPATTPANPTFVTYNASEDASFLPKNIFSEELYVPGLVLGQSGEKRLDATGRTDVGAFVFKGEFGKCYEVKVPAGVPCVTSAIFFTNPRSLTAGDYRTSYTSVQGMVQNPSEEVCFMYNCRTYDKNEYLVIYTGTDTPVYIGERTIIADADTQGPWYVPETVDAVTNTQYSWTSEQFVNNLYEPLRNRYPDYITRTSIGKDATGQYNMYCYAFTPENYETTIFINGGTHGDEGVGYFALAKCMELIANATPEDPLLYTMRQKVRFVVIPLVNVWSVSNSHSRYNGNSQDINRDYQYLTQQESKNVMACFQQYAEDVSVVMDFHIANAAPADAAVYFNFINYSDNAVANYKTTNHMYQRYKELGYGGTMKDLSRVPGSYKKGSQYFEGRIWNEFGVPTITVEYLTTSTFPAQYTSKCMTLAVETYMNFIIQNGLFYLQ